MSQQNNNSPWSHLLFAAGAFMFGTWAARQQLADSKKSRAEKDYPQDSEAAFNEIAAVLDEWEPSAYESEDEYVDDLAVYLEQESGRPVERWPVTEVGSPDILIDDLIALELKVSPNKNERNRCVGQCADYSRLWITWMVMIDLKPSKAGNLQRILDDNSLEHILVWNYR